MLDRFLDLLLEQRPQRLGDALAGTDVEVHRVEHGAPPDVVLLLIERPVADTHRTGAVVAGQMVEFGFLERALAADAVHHLQRMRLTVVRTRHVVDEVEEVVGLTVQPERVEAPPQREGGIANPRVAIVPVAFSAWCFR